MTTAEPKPPLVPAQPRYPWHSAPPPVRPDPARRVLRGHRAGLVTRVLANVVDVVLVALVVLAGYGGVAAILFLLHPARFTFPSPGSTVLLVLGLGVLAVYFAVTWALVDGSYGDRLLGLRVTGSAGGRLHWWHSVVRAVLCVVFPIGLFWVLVSRENRSLQDLLLRTSVVYDE